MRNTPPTSTIKAPAKGAPAQTAEQKAAAVKRMNEARLAKKAREAQPAAPPEPTIDALDMLINAGAAAVTVSPAGETGEMRQLDADEDDDAAVMALAASMAADLDDDDASPASDDTAGDAAGGWIPEGKSAAPRGKKWVLAPTDAGDDYVPQLVDDSLDPVIFLDPDEFHDDLELGEAYYRGDNARFEYRWMNADAQLQLDDRKHGFIPMKDPMDKRFRKEGAHVVHGDMILARRPREIGEARAREKETLNAQLSGQLNQFAGYGDAMEVQGVKNPVPTFGEVSTGNGSFAYDDVKDRAAAAKERNQHYANGRRQFAVGTYPGQRDRMAERTAAGL